MTTQEYKRIYDLHKHISGNTRSRVTVRPKTDSRSLTQSKNILEIAHISSQV